MSISLTRKINKNKRNARLMSADADKPARCV